MMNIKIRPLTEADTEEFQALRLRALREHPEAFAQSYESQLHTPMPDVARRLRETSEATHDFILGMFSEDTLIGMVGFRRERGEKVMHKGSVWGMYVAAEAQGHGLGRMLIRDAISRAAQMPGLEQINLAVVSDNASARNLYLSLGFEVYGREKRAVIVNGEYLDDEFMTLFLDRQAHTREA